MVAHHKRLFRDNTFHHQDKGVNNAMSSVHMLSDILTVVNELLKGAGLVPGNGAVVRYSVA